MFLWFLYFLAALMLPLANTVTALPQDLPARPFLKWAGGKGRLIPQYQPYFPRQYRTYYEPFLGGGAIFFHLQPRQALLMDINPELVNVYRCVRDSVTEVITHLESHARLHSSTYYYQVRASIPSAPAERAARLLYLNKTCFNGLYRENSRGEFNVPLGRYAKPAICNPGLLQAAARALQTVEIYQGTFSQVLNNPIGSEDFVYFDPPYYPLSSTSNFTAYHRHNFDTSAQILLRDVFVTLANRGVKLMLSNSDCPFVRELYQDFAASLYPIQAPRAINSRAQSRGPVSEVLVTANLV